MVIARKNIVGFVAVLVSTLTAAAAPVDSAVTRRLEVAATADVLIFLTEEPSLARAARIIDRRQRIEFVRNELIRTATRTQAPVIQELLRQGLSYQAFYVTNAVAVRGATRDQITRLSGVAGVRLVALDAVFTALPLPTVPVPHRAASSDAQENLVSIGADRVWNELKVDGRGMVVASLDSGVAWSHEALIRQYRGNKGLRVEHDYNWHDAIHQPIGSGKVQCGLDSPAPCDDTGHGTHTIATAVGSDGAANKIGVAPGAKWIGCRSMDRGAGKASTYLECFEFFMAPYPVWGNSRDDGRPELAPHIINNSWACPSSEGCRGDEFLSTVRHLQEAGIAIVAALGNDGPSCATAKDAPGFYSGELMAVAAIDHSNGEPASFSSRGPSAWNQGVGPDLSAPGQAIRSAVPRGGLGNGLYDYKSGTSMASPHVAGVIALVWAAKPALVGQVKATFDLLKKTAKPKTSSQTCGAFDGGRVPNAVYGYGIVNAFAAVAAP